MNRPGDPIHGPQPHTMQHKVHTKEIDHRVHDGREVLMQILKAVKTFSIYMHNPDSVEGFVKSAHGSLTSFLAANSTFPIVISGCSIKYLGEEIYREESDQLSFAYKFDRDGIRKLVFLRGITLDELREFSRIAAVCAQGHDKTSVDTVSLLWKVSFDHIECTVVEGLSPILGSTGLDEKTMEREVERVAERITTKLLRGGGPMPALAESRTIPGIFNDEAQDTERAIKELEFDGRGIERLGEAAGGIDIGPAEVRKAAESGVEEAEEGLIVLKLVKILVALVRHGFDERESEDIAENVLLALDMLLVKGNFGGAAAFLGRLEELAGSQGGPAEVRERFLQLRRRLSAGFGTDERLEKIRQILCGRAIQDGDGLVAILGYLDERAVKKLPEMVEHIPVRENLILVCRAFHYKRPGLDFVAKTLMRSDNDYLVFEGLRAASMTEFEGKAEAIRVLLDHPNRDVRFEALRAIATTSSEDGRKYIAKALEDEDREIMKAALDAVRRSDPTWAGRTLVKFMTQEEFKNLPPEIQLNYFKAAAFTNSPEVFALFGDIMIRKAGLFHRKEANKERMMVVDAIRSEPSLVAYKILNVYCNDQRVPPDIREYCGRAMQEVRKAMVGE